MKYKIIILLIISFSTNSNLFCQRKSLIVVDYDFRLILNNIKNYKAILIQDDSLSQFKFFKSEDTKYLTEKNGNYKFLISNKLENIIYSDKFQKINLEIVEGIGKEKYYQIIDSINTSNWKITDESKIIGGYKTLKAYKKFKGREYSVWFAPEIPGFFGPLKLHGLPGLILEISDSRNEILLIAKKIEFQKVVEKIEFPRVKYPKISRMNYNKLVEKELESLTKTISSKLDRNFKMEVHTISQKSIEIEE